MAYRLSAGRGCRQHAVVGAVCRPGAERSHRHGAAREPRPRDRGCAGGCLHRRAQYHAGAVLSAGRLQPRPQPRALHAGGRGAAWPRCGSLLHALPGRVGCQVAARPLRSRASADRVHAGSGVCERAGPPGGGAVLGNQCRLKLRRTACAGQAAGDRATDREELHGHAAHHRAALQGWRGFETGIGAGPVAKPAGTGGDPRA